jgi:hypothetical protein
MPFCTSPPISVFWHVVLPEAAAATAAPGTALQATFVAAPLTAPLIALFAATCFALSIIPPNRLFFGFAESATAESEVTRPAGA